METDGAPSRSTSNPIAQALASYDAFRQPRTRPRRYVIIPPLRLKRPSFKPLVLSVEPTATVRRVGGIYECYIDGVLVNCRGEHSTPDRAWLCLARFLAAREARP